MWVILDTLLSPHKVDMAKFILNKAAAKLHN